MSKVRYNNGSNVYRYRQCQTILDGTQVLLCMLITTMAVCMQRAMGEFGAVSVISGNIIGKTQTLTLFVEGAYKEYNTEAAFSAAVLLSFLAVVTLFVKGKVEESAE